MPNSFGSLQKLNGMVAYHSLPAVGHALGVELGRMPVALKVLLENLVRHEDGVTVTPDDIAALARWPDPVALGREVAFHPVRVLMPDSSGVPLLIDLAAMRDVMAARGLDPRRVDPSVATDLVIDHSVRVDFAGTPDAYARNVHAELERNCERYGVVKWAMGQFRNLRVVPPGNGIVHQVNIEHFAQVVACAERDGHTMAFPDSLVGMDSHTTMVNALAVFGWGVGGIEAATAMFGQPVGLPTPRVVGCRLIGAPRPGVMCTDIVLAITRLLRGADVLAAVVEFCGPALDASLAARPGNHRQHGARIRCHDGLLPDRRGDAAVSPANRPRGRPCCAGRTICQSPRVVARAGTGVPDGAGIRSRQRAAVAGRTVAAGEPGRRWRTHRSGFAPPTLPAARPACWRLRSPPQRARCSTATSPLPRSRPAPTRRIRIR